MVLCLHTYSKLTQGARQGELFATIVEKRISFHNINHIDSKFFISRMARKRQPLQVVIPKTIEIQVSNSQAS